MELQRCGDYILTERINEGGTAEVFLAMTSDRKNVVVRKLLPRFKFSLKKRREFSRGLEIQAQLSHPNIVRVLLPPTRDMIPFSVLEFVDGINMRQAMFHKEYFTDNPILVLKQILNGLLHIHRNGFLHLDFKPENILVSRYGEIKIMDFDLSEPIPKKPRKHSQINGTLNYLAPELILKRPFDKRADIFSLGIIMFELFTGQKPFVGLNRNEVMEDYTNLNQPFRNARSVRPDIPEGIDQIISSCIQKKDGDRYPSVDLIIRDLHETYGVQ